MCALRLSRRLMLPTGDWNWRVARCGSAPATQPASRSKPAVHLQEMQTSPQGAGEVVARAVRGSAAFKTGGHRGLEVHGETRSRERWRLTVCASTCSCSSLWLGPLQHVAVLLVIRGRCYFRSLAALARCSFIRSSQSLFSRVQSVRLLVPAMLALRNCYSITIRRVVSMQAQVSRVFV